MVITGKPRRLRATACAMALFTPCPARVEQTGTQTLATHVRSRLPYR